MDRNTFLELIPAYALGALDPAELAEVEILLKSDAEAQYLLAEYQAVSEALILATPARRAPAHLQGDLRRRLAASRPQPAPASPPKQAENITALPSRRPPIWIPVAAAAAFLLIVGALLLFRNPVPPDPAQLYAQIAAQPDALHIPITPVMQLTTHGELVVSADHKQAVFRVADLPAITVEQTYQLWLVDPNGARSGGLLQFANAQGPNYIVLPLEKPVNEYVGFGVSVEPSGGSPDPKGPTGPRAFGVTISL